MNSFADACAQNCLAALYLTFIAFFREIYTRYNDLSVTVHPRRQGMSLLLLFFYIVLGIASTRLFTRLILSTSYKFQHMPTPEQYPPISIIVPAYNEEITIQKCVNTLLQLDYSQYEIIVVDDGSTDHTLGLVQSFTDPRLKLISQPNQGKAHALNTGINHVQNEFIVTVDADTTLHKDALRHIAKRFSTDHQLGAIAGNVKVDSEPGLLNALQAAEYTLGINLIRKTQSMLGCVMIVPGPIAALRKTAIEQAGYFSEDTFAEDFDITMQILKAGYKIQYEDHALAFTAAPKNLEDLLKQRRRWYRGMIQVLVKHRNMFLRSKYGMAGIIGVPSLWFTIVETVLNAALVLLTVFTTFLLGQSLIAFTSLLLYMVLEIAIGA